MSEISKELCEVCGIKPRYGVYQNFGDLDNDYRLVTNVRKYRLIADTRYDVDDEDLRNLEPIYYPDFTQPENFLKLMELRVKGLSGGNLTLMGILNKEYWLSDRQDYIRFLCRYFIPDLTPYWQDKLKQAIRETEWVYD